MENMTRIREEHAKMLALLKRLEPTGCEDCRALIEEVMSPEELQHLGYTDIHDGPRRTCVMCKED